jgi:serine phosphatase RsbU (regulator of sigma subunit)
MQAAMTVSLLVGTVRTEAEHTSSPARLMQTLNRRSVGRGTGFTTCLILHATKTGEVLTANAGHLQPYLQGEELALEAGLPLGFVAEMVSEETRFLLPAGERLTLVTDGIVEATNARKGLFGFDRTLAISGESAGAIAEQPEQFSIPADQADDITVLTLRLTAAEGAAAV